MRMADKVEVGMGVTEILYSDKHAYTVIEVSKSGKKASIQRDTATRTDDNGLSEVQSYRYEENLDGEIQQIKLYADGLWHINKRGKGKGNVVVVGIRHEYRDPTF